MAAKSAHGHGLARHVDRELNAFLDCGLLHRGFARVYCRRCRAEHLVAFSCKNRALCPSCTARRMDDCAAHLVDRVLPRANYRQWVVTFPRRVRYHLAADPKLASLASREVLRTIFGWRRRIARGLGHRPGRSSTNAAVTFVQRFNSALELSLHFHNLVPDAVFVPDPRRADDPDARPRIVSLAPPTTVDVERLLVQIIARITRLLKRHGRLADDHVLDDEPEPQLLLALRPVVRAAAPGTPLDEHRLPPLCARQQGYSLHAATWVHRNDRAGLERLARYGLRPPLALGRLSRASDGTVLYQMKRRFSDGTQTPRFVPQEFLLRLCALVPPPRFHMVRYAGLFAPNARGRFALTGRGPRRAAPSNAIAPTRPAAAPAAPHPDAPDDPTRARRLDWATLLKRSFGIDALTCPRCGHRMQLLAVIEALWPDAVPLRRPRRPR